MKYMPTIGLEIHAELKTKTKMFCHSKNDSEEKKPNVNVCPICMGHPGTLPVINKEAVKHVLKVGVAVGGELANFTEFDRKNYFYPDIPKGYQISQYKFPLVKGGTLHNIQLTRIHLEEDTGRSIHKGSESLVDFNRAGVPLMELVTEPVIANAQMAVAFAKELQLLLQYLNVSDANMEKGEMRVEANVSVSPKSKIKSQKLGTKVEVKNLNSFKSVERAIEYEIKRQTSLLEKGEKVAQETRGWDENKEITFSQRQKEESHDYRYFPDPDLPKLFISEIPEFKYDVLAKELSELPWKKRERLIHTFKIRPQDAETYIRIPVYGKFFDSVIQNIVGDKSLILLSSNYISSDIIGLSQEKESVGKIEPQHFASLMKMIKEKKVSSRGAKDILKEMFGKGGNPEKIAKEKNLLQTSDTETLSKIIEKVIEANPSVVSDYRAGKETALQYLVGQGMKESKGSANPEILKELLKKKISTS